LAWRLTVTADARGSSKTRLGHVELQRIFFARHCSQESARRPLFRAGRAKTAGDDAVGNASSELCPGGCRGLESVGAHQREELCCGAHFSDSGSGGEPLTLSGLPDVGSVLIRSGPRAHRHPKKCNEGGEAAFGCARTRLVPQDGSKQRFGLPASDELSYSIRVSILHTPGTTLAHADASVTISLRAPHRHPRRLRTRPTPPNTADQFRALRVGPSGPLAYW
jgi:hypothetical protein